MSDDITFCGSDCQSINCFRHPSNIKASNIPHSFAYLKGTEDCPMKKQEVRLIDANALKEELLKDEYVSWECENAVTHEDIKRVIDNAPTVEPEITNGDLQLAMTESHKLGYEMAKCKYERPKGEWLLVGHNDTVNFYKCSICGYEEHDNFTKHYYFCPNCGADMGGDDNDNSKT